MRHDTLQLQNLMKHLKVQQEGTAKELGIYFYVVLSYKAWLTILSYQ